MKKWAALLISFVLLISPNLKAQSYAHIFELKGLQDSLSNTHLFYRYGSSSTLWYHCWSKSIYHIDIENNFDTLFVSDVGTFSFEGCFGISYLDYELYGNDPTKFICVGFDYNYDPWVAILRHDGPVYSQTGNVAYEVEISRQNQNVLYMTVDESALFKSTDAGLNWTIEEDSIAWIDYAMVSLSKNNDNQIYGINNNNLVRSEDEGFNYIIVDNSEWSFNTDMYYDVDGQHIYGITTDWDPIYQVINFKLNLSNNNGNPFTWSNILTQNKQINFAYDEFQSGEIYYSYKSQIFKSTDFGNEFSIYKNLDRNITGLYKKSDSNILYASTPLKIYEITPDTIQVIKSLPIPPEVLNFYPLAIGNKWIYDESTVVYDPYPNYYHSILVKEVLGDTIAPNGKHYFILNDETLWESSLLERVDSSDGKVYRYYEDTTLTENEYVAYDLLAEVGDTISSFRMGFNTVMFTTMYAETTFEKWGLTKPKKIFEEYTLHPPIFSITKDIGLDSIYFYFDFGDTYITLKGCIIDGVVYGDTTTVGVEDEEIPIANEFTLEQNYPNPFNPTTNIKFRIAKFGFVNLKVFDILGNEIITLVNEEKPAGEYEVDFNATGLPSGIYFYQIKSGNFIETKKMILLK